MVLLVICTFRALRSLAVICCWNSRYLKHIMIAVDQWQHGEACAHEPILITSSSNLNVNDPNYQPPPGYLGWGPGNLPVPVLDDMGAAIEPHFRFLLSRRLRSNGVSTTFQNVNWYCDSQGGFGFFFKDIRSNFFLRPPRAEPTDRGGNNIPNMEITYPI